MTKILTVLLDDNEADLDIIRTYFERNSVKDYEMYVDVATFRDAMTDDIGVYVLDHSLGSILGIDIVRHIRSKYGHKPYIIILSNNENGRTIAEYTNEHVFCYLFKADKGVYTTLCNRTKEAQRLAQERQDLEDFKADMRNGIR